MKAPNVIEGDLVRLETSCQATDVPLPRRGGAGEDRERTREGREEEVIWRAFLVGVVLIGARPGRGAAAVGRGVRGSAAAPESRCRRFRWRRGRAIRTRSSDPFRPFTLDLAPHKVDEPLTPLQRYELSQLTVAAVMLEINPPRALLQDNSGMGFIVTPGTPIGRNRGVVKSIEPGKVDRGGESTRLLRPRAGAYRRARDAEGGTASERKPGVTMMRWASGLGAVISGLSLCGAVVLVGCAPPPAALEEGTRTEVNSPAVPNQHADQSPAEAAAAAAQAANSFEIRELKIIDDNGQQGVFAKLSHAASAVSHYTLPNPNRIVVEMTGERAGEPRRRPVSGGEPAHPAGPRRQRRGQDSPDAGAARRHHSDVHRRRPQRHAGRVPRRAAGHQPARARADRLYAARPARRDDGPAADGGGRRGAAGAPRRLLPRRPLRRLRRRCRRSWCAAAERPGPPCASSRPARRKRRRRSSTTDSPSRSISRMPTSTTSFACSPSVSNLNIVATDDVQGKMTLRLFDVPWDQALDIILQVHESRERSGGQCRPHLDRQAPARGARGAARAPSKPPRPSSRCTSRTSRSTTPRPRSSAELISGSSRAQQQQQRSACARPGS